MANVCDLQSRKGVPTVGNEVKSENVVQKSCVTSTARNKKVSFRLPVTLWVYKKKVQTKALVDSGATTNLVNRVFVEKHHLVMNKLATLYDVRNVDGTPNKAGPIKYYVRAYVEFGSHKSTHYLFVTNLGDKKMMLGYLSLYTHNPQIDWQAGEWEFTRCPDTCADRVHKMKVKVLEGESDDLQHEPELIGETPLDKLGEEDPDNPYINWVNLNDPVDYKHAKVITTMFDSQNIEEDFDDTFEDEDTKNWKFHVSEWLHEYGNIFLKCKSERMPERKPYDHLIDFVEGTSLPKPGKLYPLSPHEQNSLDEA